MHSCWRCILLGSVLSWANQGLAKDYILTIGGGYAPSGNQASLEANVIFFQQTVGERHPSPVEHQIYFADGFDRQADLQVLAPQPAAEPPVLTLLNSIFDIRHDRYQYRDHQVKDIRGPLTPSVVRGGFDEIAERIDEGDRLIIYVTAHGSSGKGSDPFNTSILCWNKRLLSMKSFSEWLDELPTTVPVIMVMAQCYCGGFANTLFNGGDASKGIAPGLRVGFFAQRHDLPAAGCRPDIENDEEYSSYFWGAFMGRLRNGKPVEQVDCDEDGRISFAEAHAYAVVASPTIDIPLKTSESFLRQYSRIGGGDDRETKTEADGEDEIEPELYYLLGTIDELAALATPDQRRIILGLAEQLEIPRQAEVAEVLSLGEAQRDRVRQLRRNPSRRGRFSRRRDLRNTILEQWPELEEPQDWSTLEILTLDQGQSFLEQVRMLPSYEAFQQSQADRTRLAESSTKAELKAVQFRRLIHALETTVYLKNLPLVASPEEIDRYRAIVAIEATSFDR